MIGIILVTHGFFGQELLKTAEDIVGRQTGAVALAVTAETGLENLSRSVEDAIGQVGSHEGVLFLVDMLGGTPCNSILMKIKNVDAEVITGVNLYMLISAFTHRP